MDPGGGLKLVEDKLKGFGATVASDVVNQIKLRSTRPGASNVRRVLQSTLTLSSSLSLSLCFRLVMTTQFDRIFHGLSPLVGSTSQFFCLAVFLAEISVQ